MPLGVMVGYLSSGFIVNAGWLWRVSIYVQAACLLPFVVGIYFIPAKFIDNSDSLEADARTEPGGSSIDHHPKKLVKVKDILANLPEHRMGFQSFASPDHRKEPMGGKHCEQLCLLFQTKLFVVNTVGLSFLFFVVTGMQFWVTEYLLVVVNANFATILISFSITSATAPTAGVIFGGWVIDRLGGFEGDRGPELTSRANSIFGFFATVAAIPAGFFDNFAVCLMLVWFVLFFGGAIVPGATGLVLSSVPSKLDSLASAMSMLAFNIVGYAGGVLIPALYMQYFMSNCVDKREQCYKISLKLGWRVVLWWSVLAWLSFIISYRFALKARSASSLHTPPTSNRPPHARLRQSEQEQEPGLRMAVVGVDTSREPAAAAAAAAATAGKPCGGSLGPNNQALGGGSAPTTTAGLPVGHAATQRIRI